MSAVPSARGHLGEYEQLLASRTSRSGGETGKERASQVGFVSAEPAAGTRETRSGWVSGAAAAGSSWKGTRAWEKRHRADGETQPGGMRRECVGWRRTGEGSWNPGSATSPASPKSALSNYTVGRVTGITPRALCEAQLRSRSQSLRPGAGVGRARPERQLSCRAAGQAFAIFVLKASLRCI